MSDGVWADQWPPPAPPLDPHAAYDWGWHEWFSVAGGVLERDGAASTVVGDGLIWSLDGGYEYVRNPLRIGPEIGMAWSHQDLDASVAPGEDPHLDVLRFSFGGRVSVDLGLFGTVYARGGIYTRDEESNDVPGFEDDSTGNYWGGGFEFWFDPRGRLGPYVRWYDSHDSDLEEFSVGFAATFIL
jgi:hypothetical protein